MKRIRKVRQVHGSCRRAEKSVEFEDDGDTNGRECTWNSPLRLAGTRDQEKNRDHPDRSIIKRS